MQNQFEEEFKYIEGYDQKYLISNYCKVISFQSKTTQIKRPSVIRRGYLQVQLSKPDSSLKCEMVYRLVAKHFLEQFDENLQVDHIDRVKSNNRVDNLRMATNIENCLNKNKYQNKQYTSKQIGVSLSGNKWHAQINIQGKVKHLGLFENEKDAARAFNLEKSKRGIFANINIISEDSEEDNNI